MTHPSPTPRADQKGADRFAPRQFWIMSRRVAACALNVWPAQRNCTRGQPCCNPKWYASWWPWSYCTSPRTVPGVPSLYGVAGGFEAETRRDGHRSCEGAPVRTYPRDSRGSVLDRRLVDYVGAPFKSNPHPYQGASGRPAKGEATAARDGGTPAVLGDVGSMT